MRLARFAAIISAVVVAAVASAAAAGGAAGHAPDPRSARADAFIRHCTDLYNQRAWNDLAAYCYNTANFADHTPEPGQAANWTGYKHTTDLEDIAFPNWKTTIIDLTAQGDRVIMRFVGTGTQTGPLGALPATGKKVTITGMRMFGLRHGRITDTWVNYDELGLLQQLGVVPKF